MSKICGVGTLEAAEAAIKARADIIGMIFAPSPRLIDINRAKEIAQAVRASGKDGGFPSISPPALTIQAEANAPEYFQKCAALIAQAQSDLGRPLLAGVFQNQDIEHIVQVARDVPLDLVQLHGTEAAAMARQIPVPVIKVFHIDDTFSADTSDMVKQGCHSLILLDTKVAGTSQQGGRGVSFDWNIARVVAEKGIPFLMAGGLTPDNVGQAVAVGQPWGVDVSSGIETDKTKDSAKIHAFVRNSKKSSTTCNHH
ncbi:anthranilate synthase / indole-3-glycerol phosphate synthase [Coemansia spiralis]|uniref:N-(5'-phosphoribosyl)anthranilate isomerase n=2 Tax=Coemansia TaxID=4863 RepID=A0A9W8L199_9FUNG|nr:isomerase-domain-containing protein [Coemansia spiralis]KAJ1995872.1 anthranilate synthase / indole-3-glycerol phosphate synthase [Coemansia umbellata]KAJ2625825.1 anthranilate synthase / indole-3-glycerol phosphate synthase [Coemansia sp. RSA 1358]KAJ2680947.1 anthranilate synthase / indole-3-glycerol phosphate synthase [Coemansia spiralis]